MSAGSILARDDTMFGVCAAIAEDFGFSPTLLRLLLAVILFYSPVGAAASYLLAAVAVTISRWCVPEPDPVEGRSDDEFLADNDLHVEAEAWEDLAKAA